MKKTLLGAVAALLLVAGGAYAQVPQIPKVLNAGTADLIPDVVGGNPTAGNQYATPQQVNGVPGYHNGGVAATAWTYTFTSGQQYFFIKPAATLGNRHADDRGQPGRWAAGMLLLDAGIQTALTWTANTGPDA